MSVINGSQKIKKIILRWWKQNKRNFSWRQTSDPYKILCSEIMLQQTNGDKVEPIYINFIDRYPNIYKLNNECLKEIEEIIKTLGLIKRASFLKNTAEIIINRHGGKVPRDKFNLMELPGVGHYIADAVLCFAFGSSRGVLDTNTIRILERVFDIKSEKSRPRTDPKLRKKINLLIGNNKCRDYNYALLDFAALVCKKRSPNCLECPVEDLCDYVKIKVNA